MIDANILIERLEERFPRAKKEQLHYIDRTQAVKECFEIINQLAEEQNNGWIPCSEQKPSKHDEYYVSYQSGVVMIQYWNGHWFTEADSFANKSVGQPIAWKPKDEPYKPKGE